MLSEKSLVGKLGGRQHTGTLARSSTQSLAKDEKEADVDWLSSILPGLKEQTVRYEEDSFLLELADPRELKWLMLPHSCKRLAWDVVILALVVYTCVRMLTTHTCCAPPYFFLYVLLPRQGARPPIRPLLRRSGLGRADLDACGRRPH